MYASELRTCGLGAVVAMLLGAGVGFGWHFFADGGRAVAAAPTPLSQQDASNPPLACPPPRKGLGADVPRLPVLSDPNNQPDTTHARDAPRLTHAARTSRTRRLDRPAGGDR